MNETLNSGFFTKWIQMLVVFKNKNRYNIDLQGIKPEWMSADIRLRPPDGL